MTDQSGPQQQQYPPHQQSQYPPQGYHQPLHVQTVAVKNGHATAALILGIAGFVLTPIPLGIGLVLGGIPDVLAIIFGIIALNRTPQLGGVGKAPAIWGLVLGGLGFLSIFIGAGTIW